MIYNTPSYVKAGGIHLYSKKRIPNPTKYGVYQSMCLFYRKKREFTEMCVLIRLIFGIIVFYEYEAMVCHNMLLKFS